MPYQLPPELRTSKFSSLPDDLREIAEAALAEKFDIPEIVVEKKKKTPPKPKEEPPRADPRRRDWDDRFEYVEIVVNTDIKEVRNPMFAINEDFDPRTIVQVEEHYRREHYQMMVDQNVPHYEVVRQIEYNIRKFIDQLRYKGVRTHGLELWHRGLRMEVNNMRDIEQFVQRSRVGGYGRY
jgi:hypothetical protein